MPSGTRRAWRRRRAEHLAQPPDGREARGSGHILHDFFRMQHFVLIVQHIHLFVKQGWLV
jgi:hypothetical protein